MRLTVENGPLAGTVVSLDRDHPTTLGSDADCALRVQEPGVAGQAAVVKALRDHGFGIKALAPGLRVNGQAVEASPLHDGDVIELGTTRIAFGQVQKRGLPQIPGYRIREELGRGGMGYVYLAEQTSLHREVALKVLSRELTEDPAFVARFVAEARAAAKLQHPNVVQVFDVDHDGETYFFAMEIMQEGSLEDWLKQNGTMPVDRALRVVADAAAGLAYAESLGIVHRDIKPDNLMLDQHGTVKIADLGLAGTAEGSIEKAIGTPHFMAPEQVLKKGVDHRTDLYALGCTFYRLVTGKTPFRGQTVKDILRAQVKDEAEPANKANPAVPAGVAAMIQRLLAKEPAARYQTANDLLEELAVLMQPPAKRGLWIGLTAAAAVVAGGAIYWAVTKPKEKQIVEVTKVYDDPEKQQFADEIKRLQKEAKEHLATIALLGARVAGTAEGELAAALDRIASEHAGTTAAAEAAQRAADLRRTLADRQHQEQQRQARIDEQVAVLQRGLQPKLDSREFALALGALDAPVPKDLQGDADFQGRVRQLRDGVLASARARLGELLQPLQETDETKLAQASKALGDELQRSGAWPASLQQELDAARTSLTTAQATLSRLAGERTSALWSDYRTMVVDKAGLRRHLTQFDYAAAAAAADTFAKARPGTDTAARATSLAAAAAKAEAFVGALTRAAAAGQVQVTAPGGGPLQLVRWDRAAGQLIVLDASRRPPKEQPLATAGWSPELWQTIAEQVPTAAPGERECFLGLVALVAHAEAASGFLGRLRADDDQSGTGEGAYPLGATLFETLLRRLPEGNAEPWLMALRDELQAGHRLAAGLRALSERRNLAAASYLDSLVNDHANSYLVAVLP